MNSTLEYIRIDRLIKKLEFYKIQRNQRNIYKYLTNKLTE